MSQNGTLILYCEADDNDIKCSYGKLLRYNTIQLSYYAYENVLNAQRHCCVFLV